MHKMAIQAPETATTPFARAATEQLRIVQAAMTDLLAEAGLSNARPTDVGRALGLDKTLAWKVCRFVGASDLGAAARHMPGASGVEILVRAAAAAGVAEKFVAQTRDADRLLRAFVAKQAGDRRTFESMLASGPDGERDERTELEERRSHFRSGAAIWGVRAQLQFLMLALKPSPTREGFLDAVQVSGFVGFERLRPDVPWTVRRQRAHSDSGAEVFKVVREPLVEARRRAGSPPLFDPYCSKPIPELRQYEVENGWVYDELAPGRVGRGGATTVVLGERYLGPIPFRRSPDNTRGVYALTVRTPVACVLFDVLLHRSLSHFGRARRFVCGLLENLPTTDATGAMNERSLMCEPTYAAELGHAAVVQTHRFPNYAPMVNDALATSGFGSLEEFRGYRTELEYPAFPCDIKMTVEIGAS